MEHTPGPWRVSSIRPTQIMDDHGIVIAECLDRGTETPFPEANARVMAAAPDMLALLEEIVEPHELTNDEVLEQARAAIQKARGEQ
jgi:hypothetical protein